jgi:type II secretory pathway pseudopilin PulG
MDGATRGTVAARARGYALMFALLAVLAVSLAAVGAVQSAKQRIQRERETELLFVGEQIRQALQSYHALVAPGGLQYPVTLEALVEDHRLPVLKRHLRRVFPDPITGETDWLLVKSQGRIVGVRSRSEDAPLKKSGFNLADGSFAKASRYSDWIFLADPSFARTSAATTSAPPEPDGTPPANPLAESLRIQSCMEKYQYPSAECIQVPPPLGKDIFSCQAAYWVLYNQCAAGSN